jgi:O-antigen ligase
LNFLFIQLYLILVLIRPQDYPALVDSMPFPLLPVTLAIALAGWLISRDKSFAAPQYFVLGSFLVVLMVSKLVNGWPGGMLEQLTLFGPIVAAFLLLANATTTMPRVRGTMVVFSLCAAVLALHGIEQAQTGVGWTGEILSQGTRIQYVGIFNDPNDLGLLFVMCLPMAMYLGEGGGMMGLKRLFWLAVAATLLYGVYLTNSRGALLSVVLLVGLYFWHRRGPVTALVFAGVCLVGMLALPSRLHEVDVDEESAAGRVDAWYQGIQMFLEHPVFGVGAGNFTENNPLTAHNSFVLILAETGYIGFTVWLAFIGYCFWMMSAVLKHEPPLPDDDTAAAWAGEKRMARTILFSLSGFFAAAFFLSRSYMIVLYLLAALAVGYYTGARERWPSLPEFAVQKDLVRWPMLSLVAIVALYVVIRGLLLAQ